MEEWSSKFVPKNDYDSEARDLMAKVHRHAGGEVSFACALCLAARAQEFITDHAACIRTLDPTFRGKSLREIHSELTSSETFKGPTVAPCARADSQLTGPCSFC
jgi:hypothetical protein